MKSSTWTCIVACALLVGCKGKNPEFCDEETPCDDPVLSFCDLDGSLRGKANTCVRPAAEPPDAGLPPDSGAVDAGPNAVLEADRTEQTFGTVVVGNASAPVEVTISNVGTGATGAIDVALQTGTQFEVVTDTCSSRALPPSEACSLTLRFLPTSPGEKVDVLTLGGAPGGSVDVALSGSAVAQGALATLPTVHDFGESLVSATGPTQLITVENTGGSPSGILSTVLSNEADFAIAVDTCSGATLAADQACTVTVRFQPSTRGAKSGSISVTATPGGTAATSLAGVGTIRLSVSTNGTGVGSVQSSPTGIDACTGACNATFSTSPVTLTATPNAATSFFAGWSGGGCIGTGSCVVATTIDQSVAATFSLHECAPNTVACEADVVTICDDVGRIESTEECALGCHPTDNRCGDIAPSNGLGSALDDAALGPIVSLPNGSTIDTDTGVVTNGETMVEITIPQEVLDDEALPVEVLVLKVRGLTAFDVEVNGTRALAIVSDGDIDLRGTFDIAGHFRFFHPSAGPGSVVSGSCAGTAGATIACQAAGGGGGGFGTVGVRGGDAGAAGGGVRGFSAGNTQLVPLRGGCPGGGGGSFGGTGAGGGAIQLVSRTSIRVRTGAFINANADAGRLGGFTCTSTGGDSFVLTGGGGGGAGGGILLEAPSVTLDAGGGLFANGGGGSCTGAPGEPGQLSTARAPGGDCTSSSTNGSAGVGGSVLGPPTTGTGVTGEEPLNGGGGGGAVGRVRINTADGTFSSSGAGLSPTPSAGTLLVR